jgi:hypothetical protein
MKEQMEQQILVAAVAVESCHTMAVRGVLV